MKSRFVTFEGIEGSGKTTVSREVRRSLESAGVSVTHAREPGGTTVSEAIRGLLLDPERTEMDPRAELFLYLASRAQLVSEVIRPALAAGKSVVCDRYLDASVAYQGWARGLGEKFVDGLNAAAVGRRRSRPDLSSRPRRSRGTRAWPGPPRGGRHGGKGPSRTRRRAFSREGPRRVPAARETRKEADSRNRRLASPRGGRPGDSREPRGALRRKTNRQTIMLLIP